MVAIYARQSIDKKDSISIKTQIEMCKRELSGDEEFQVYTDKGYSGKNTNRPEFSRLMQAVEAGEVSRIVVYRLDRISRSITDFAGIMEKLEAHGAGFVSSTEKFDTSAPMGRAMLYIIMVFAQLERETIAERIRDNYYSRGKGGVWLGGPAPFGFRSSKQVVGGKRAAVLEPVEEIDIVRKLFDEYASTQKSLGTLGKELTARYGGQYGAWNSVRLSRILHNPIYVRANADIYRYYQEQKCVLVNAIDEYDGKRGVMLYGKRDRAANKYRCLEEHVAALSLTEGVVEPELFLRCQYKMEKNRQIKNSGKGKYTWMTGLVKCGYCGYGMTVKVYKEKKYLYCSGRQNNHCDAAHETIYLEDVESIADRYVYQFLTGVDRSQAASQTATDGRVNELKIQMHKLNEQIENLINSLSGGEGVAMDYINRRIAELDGQKQALTEEIQACVIEEAQPEIPEAEEWSSAGFEEKRELAGQIIERILVKNDTVEIQWKY